MFACSIVCLFVCLFVWVKPENIYFAPCVWREVITPGNGCTRNQAKKKRSQRKKTKEKKEKKEKRENSKIVSRGPGRPRGESSISLVIGTPKSKRITLGDPGFPRRIPYPPCPWDTHVMTHSKIRGENPRTFKSLLAWTPPPFKCLFALEMFLQCKAEWSNGQQQRHEG